MENVKKLVDKFERRINAEIRRQKVLERIGKVKLNSRIEEIRRSKLPVRYIVKLLFRWDNGKFIQVRKELVKIEVSFSRGEILKGE